MAVSLMSLSGRLLQSQRLLPVGPQRLSPVLRCIQQGVRHAMTAKAEQPYYSNPNFPRDPDNQVLHLGLKEGDVARRILTVGDPARAQRIALLLDAGRPVSVKQSKRGDFTTYTGTYKNVDVSIVSIGMGKAMMDFLVREARAISVPPILIVRYGTCGSIDTSIPPGTVVISDECVSVDSNVAAFADAGDQAAKNRYNISAPISGDLPLLQSMRQTLSASLDAKGVLCGLNATADSFYSSQGRIDPNFADHNEELIDVLTQTTKPQARTMEMETFQLYHLARCSKQSVRAAAAVIVLANRVTGEVLSSTDLARVEAAGGRGILDAMTSVSL